MRASLSEARITNRSRREETRMNTGLRAILALSALFMLSACAEAFVGSVVLLCLATYAGC